MARHRVGATGGWQAPLGLLLVDIEEQLDRFIESGDPRAGTLDADPNAPVALMLAISSLWDLLVNLGRMYEELCREWFLPTYLGDLTNP